MNRERLFLSLALWSYASMGRAVVYKPHQVPTSDFAEVLNVIFLDAKMRLNNYQDQTSFFDLQGTPYAFNIPVTKLELMGGVSFFLNEVYLERAVFLPTQDYYELVLEFRDMGRGIKGSHSFLGDHGMPDFQLKHFAMKLKAVPVVVEGQPTLLFSGTQLEIKTRAFTGCQFGSLDFCSEFFETYRPLERDLKFAVENALNSLLVQQVLRRELSQAPLAP